VDDAGDPFARKLPGRLGSLDVTEFRQPCIDNARIPAHRGEVEVEFALPMTQQDHRRAIQAGWAGGNPPEREKYLCLGPRVLI